MTWDAEVGEIKRWRGKGRKKRQKSGVTARDKRLGCCRREIRIRC